MKKKMPAALRGVGNIAEALMPASGENLVRKEIEHGMPSTLALAKYGIL